MIDSDSDNSLPKRQRNDSGKAILADFDDGDSDSDDSLLANDNTTFRSSKRKKTTMVDKILEDALKRSNRRLESEGILNRMKQGANQDDDVITSARKMKETKDTSKALEKKETPKTAEAKEYHAALEDIADTQLTITEGSRPMISFQQDALPSSTSQAVEYLQFILGQKTTTATLVLKALKKNVQNGTLHSFLLTKRLLAPAFHKQHTAILPGSLLRWFFEVACTSSASAEENQSPLEGLARGAYLTLSHLWMDRQAFSTEGWFLATRDMPKQLNQWFGVGKDVESTTTPQQQQQQQEDDGTTRQTKTPASCSLALTRYLHLWEIAFSQGMVYVSDLKHISQSFVSLAVTSLDPMFASSHTRADGPLSNLQKLLCHLLDAAKTVCEIERDYHTWSSQLTMDVFDSINKLGTDDSGSKDEDDTTPWAYQARVVRNLLSENETAALIPQLCDQVFQSCFNQTAHDWNSKAASILTNQWQLEQEMADSIQWRALASSFMALENLTKVLEKDKAMSAAIVEVSFLCLQAGVALFHHNGTKCTALYNAYDAFEKTISQIFNRSKGLVLASPHYLRINYFCSCFRQYPRLEKLDHEANAEQLQSTVDSFFSINKTSSQ
jgi:hypothetical protein